VWPETHLKLGGAATWPVLRPDGGRPVNHHCERQPRPVIVPAAHICKSNKRTAYTNQHDDHAVQWWCIFDISMASACEHVLDVQDSCQLFAGCSAAWHYTMIFYNIMVNYYLKVSI